MTNFPERAIQSNRVTSRSPKRYSRSHRSPSSDNKSNSRHYSQSYISNKPQPSTWQQKFQQQDGAHVTTFGTLQNISNGNDNIKKMLHNEANKREEPPDETRRPTSEMEGGTPLCTSNSAERRIARYKDERRRQLATQIANRLSSNRSFSSSSSTSSSEEDQHRGNSKHKRKRGSLESCSGGSGSLGKLSTETNPSLSTTGGASRCISNKPGSSYSKYKRYQRSKRPNHESHFPPSLASADNISATQSSTSIFQEGLNQNSAVSSIAPRRRRRKSFNYDQSYYSPSINAGKRGKSPAAKVKKEKKLSAAQLGDADGEEDDNDDEINVKDRELEKKAQPLRGERQKHSPEHIYHQIGSDALIRVSKKPSPSGQKVSGSSLSSSRHRHYRHEGGNNPIRHSHDGVVEDSEMIVKNAELKQDNSELLLKIKDIKSKIKDISKPGRSESFNVEKSPQKTGTETNSAFIPSPSPRSRFIARAQSFESKCNEYSNDSGGFDNNKILITSHQASRKLRKSSLPRGNFV